MLIGSSLDKATLQELDALPSNAPYYQIAVVNDRIYLKKKTGGWLEIFTNENSEDLPIISSGDANKVVSVKNDETGYELKGSTFGKTATKSNDYVILDNDNLSVIYFDDTSSDRACTLPTASDNAERIITMKNISTHKGKITVSGELSETIDGESSFVLDAKYSYVKVQSDGSNWQILDWFIHDKTYNLTVASAGGSASSILVYGRIYRTKDNYWKVSLNGRYNTSSAISQIELTDLTFSDIFSSVGQGLSSNVWDYTSGCHLIRCNAANDDNFISTIVSAGNPASILISGEIILKVKPSIVA